MTITSKHPANNKAAIIGGGVIGGGWVARFLLNGWDVAVHDPDPEAPRKIAEVLANARRSLPALSDVALPAEGTLQFVDTVEAAVQDAAWIQESAPERLDIKHALFGNIQAHCRVDAVIGSSTSGFKPSSLGELSDRPEQIVVAHPFNPVYLLPLIELVGALDTVARASEILNRIGMHPLHVRHEIDAHLADRFLEAVWREALWLVRDGIATTEEIDDAIRYGFGLRWAQMGLFETYRVAGGEAGMAHFIAQFGPCLAWPWTRLTDVPELDDALIAKIAEQSDAQSGHLSIRELERLRDDNLVALLRALKGRDHGAGALLNRHDKRLRSLASNKLAATTHGADATSASASASASAGLENPPLPAQAGALLQTVARTIPIDWTDYNGHMNESRYGQIFSDAADAVLAQIGTDDNYVARGFSWFTVDIHIRFLLETHAGESVVTHTQVLAGGGKKLRLFHTLRRADGQLLATGEQLLLHVSLETRRTCLPQSPLDKNLDALVHAHATLPWPDGASAKEDASA